MNMNFIFGVIAFFLIQKIWCGRINEISHNQNFSIVFNEGVDRDVDESKSSTSTGSPHNDNATKSPLGHHFVFNGR